MHLYKRFAWWGVILWVCSAIAFVVDKHLLTCTGEYGVSIPLAVFSVPLGAILLLCAFALRQKSRGDKFWILKTVGVLVLGSVLFFILLSSLFNCARCIPLDLRIKSNLHNSRAEAEIYFDENGGSYAGFCTSPYIEEISAQIRERNIRHRGLWLWCDASEIDPVSCSDSAETFAISSRLLESPHYYCVDSTGFAEDVATPVTGGACPTELIRN